MNIEWNEVLREECRNAAGIVLCRMTPLAQEVLGELAKKAQVQWLDSEGKWAETYSGMAYQNLAYRVNPDFVMENPNTKCWQDCPVYKSPEFGLLAFTHPRHRTEMALDGAVRFSDFMCFVYNDGVHSSIPRGANSEAPADIPLAVRIWTGEQR